MRLKDKEKVLLVLKGALFAIPTFFIWIIAAIIHIGKSGNEWTLFDAIIMGMVSTYMLNIVGFMIIIGLLLVLLKSK